MSELGLRSGSQAAVENGQQGILPHRESLAALGDMPIDDVGELELLGNRIEGGGSSELEIERVSGLGSGGLLEELADVLGFAQIALFDVAGAAVHPSGLNQVIVAVAADSLGDDGGHLLGNMIGPSARDVKGKATSYCGGITAINSTVYA